MIKENPFGTTVIFGGQVGSEGKGAVVGYLARRYGWGAAICSFMTNAGHTWIGDGKKIVVQQIPMAVVAPDIPHLLIGPGSAITISQLFKEIDAIEAAGFEVRSRLRIHPRAMIIEPMDVEFEKTFNTYLGSTAKGCGSAQSRKMSRFQSVKLARDFPALYEFLADTTVIVNDVINAGHPVLIEGSQGFDLDLNHGIEYPYCTSRGTTPAQTLADCGIAPSAVETTIATIRTYPIRVGNVVEGGTQIGYSGPFGAKELTWEEITKRSGSPEPLEERTTVTQRVRRIFELDLERLSYMINVTRPTFLALTFADYLDHNIKDLNDENIGKSAHVRIDRDFPKVADFIVKIEEGTGVSVGLLKTGANDNSMLDLLYNVDPRSQR